MNLFQSNRSKKHLAITALMTAAALAAGHANAKTLLKVDVIGTYNGTDLSRANAWNATWGPAWDACRDQRKDTRSLNMTWHQFGNPSPAGSNKRSVAATWECRDTN
ncbi:hypothetical protein AB6Q13_04235 [Ralstonia solanacearum]|uniref:hypothetical protein n=1 Tax=Ralstonia solanacearum TaxID=305 RepID=UPI0007D7FB0E|nr:hypothetical protein [Ralstonia solanacearum]AST35292.2 hypothetical protein CDC46_25020 [Ralstonia solanacearum]MDB0509849.1 hypothetical protein [Ralstonia solanacearum]MDB0511920.1 hypothetical protein [Ralstonia solanacearum]MDB0567354.1 hypothetical protein [Ralstonia solanacearum]MDB0577608.1 hypothetical protein [Ralstonia solanacearum]